MNKKIKAGLVTLLAVGLLCLALPAMAAAPAQIPESDGVIVMAGAEAAFKVVSADNDESNHVIVLEDKAGKQQNIKLGPQVKNFNQLKAGDFVVVSDDAQVALFYDKIGQVPGVGVSEMVFTAPKGSKPGLIVVNKTFFTVQITAVDAANKTITVTLPDNTVKTVNAPKVDYSKVKAGHDVVVLLANEKSIMVDAPR